MNRVRPVLGLVAAVLLVLSSGAHSFLGWKQLGSQLAATNAPTELVLGLKIGWMFGGVVMLTLGFIVFAIFLARFRGRNVPVFPAILISIAYLVFGVWALVVSNFDLFFLVFIIPGVLLVIASTPGQAKAE